MFDAAQGIDVAKLPNGGAAHISFSSHGPVHPRMQGPNLTADEERHLLEAFHRSPSEHQRRAALSSLWLSYSKLVAALAARFRRSGLEIADLIGAGQLGLYGAIANFDLYRSGIRLATYAIPRIRHEIQEYIRRTHDPVRRPDSDAHRQLFRSTGRLFEDARRSCQRDGITSPNHAELCRRVGARIGMSEYEVERSLQLVTTSHISLDEPAHADGGGPAEVHANRCSPEADMVRELDYEEARRRINRLSGEILGSAERLVFHARCMCAGDPARLEELAAELHVSSERIYQLEASAKRKIATALIAQGFAEAGAIEAMGAVRSRARRGSKGHRGNAERSLAYA